MAEINIERKPQRSPWPIVLAVLAVLAIAAAVWYYTQQPRMGDGTVEMAPTSTDTTVTVPPGGAAA